MECIYCFQIRDKLIDKVCYNCKYSDDDIYCPGCESQPSKSGLCNNCVNKTNLCLVCGKKYSGIQYYCSSECRGDNAVSQAKKIARKFIDWIQDDFQCPGKIQHEFENAFTKWLGIPCWFPINKICELTKTEPEKIYEAFSRLGTKVYRQNAQESIRFTNQDEWSLQDLELSKILHSYLRIRFRDILTLLSE